MGKQNKARRAAKARSRQKARGYGAARRARAAGETGGPDWSGFADAGWSAAEVARNALLRAFEEAAGDPRRTNWTDELASMPTSVVDREVEAIASLLVSGAWDGGWQPSELARHARLRGSSAATGRLARVAIAVDHRSRPSTTLDPRWIAQIAAMELPEVNGRRGWFGRWATDEALDRREALDTAVDLLGVLSLLPHIEHLTAGPGAADDGSGPGVGTQHGSTGGELDPLLEKIRNLLAKAESTTFEAEATALTAKAQELMTRHAIDAASLHSDGEPDETPVAIRIPVDAPYVDAKSLLLQTVAEAGRCRSVFHSGLDMSTVVGFADDVAGVEILFTSLLVQAQSALADAARSAPPGTRTRSQSYRSAFLLAYTHRIGDRLEEINEHVYAEATAEHGSSFLPVLRSRSDRLDDHMRERFAHMTSSHVRGGYDQAGWVGGRLAADRAAINLADLEHDVAQDREQEHIGELT